MADPCSPSSACNLKKSTEMDGLPAVGRGGVAACIPVSHRERVQSDPKCTDCADGYWADGASPVVIDNFVCIGEQIDEKTVVFQHYENGKEITEEEFNRKIEDYAKPLKGLEWQEIY